MSEASRYLFLAGSLPFLVLGVAHAFATPRSVEESRGLSPRSPALRSAMRDDSVLLTRRTSLWLAWVGFNLSHSLGAILFGGVVLIIGRSRASFASQAQFIMPFAVLVAAAYLAIAVRYWFRTPIAGIAFSLACFVTSYFLSVSRTVLGGVVIPGLVAVSPSPPQPIEQADMKVVTVLMGAGCDSGSRAAERLRSLVSEMNLEVRVDEVTITTQAEAERQHYLGSPTIQVAGQDVDPNARALRSFAMT